MNRKQHRDRADVDDDEDHRQELRAQEQEQPRGADEGQNQEQNGMDRIPGDDHGKRRSDEDRRENPEE